jgi:hypothetical protein
MAVFRVLQKLRSQCTTWQKVSMERLTAKSVWSEVGLGILGHEVQCEWIMLFVSFRLKLEWGQEVLPAMLRGQGKEFS